MTSRDAAVATGATLGDLLHLERRAFGADTQAALGFTVVNETFGLAPYRQAALFLASPTGRLSLAQASGLVHSPGDTPYAVWLTQLANSIPAQPAVQALTPEQADAGCAATWRDWLPPQLLACNLQAADGKRTGLCLYARDAAWTAAETALLERLHETYAYCLQALSRTPGTWRQLVAALVAGRRWLLGALGLAAVLLLVPVRLSAVAPAEVVALSAVAIAAPQDGVVGTVHVQPGAAVKAGDRLFSLDDRGLESRRAVALRSLQSARADQLAGEQRAFEDNRSKGELAPALGRVKEKEAELAQIEGTLERVTVRAPADGVVIFGDANDWLGRPVQTGERIMQLADPRDAGVLVWLPVADAINLQAGAPLRLFLHTQPLAPLPATLVESSYQAVQSPAGVSAYRVRARLEPSAGSARIGLRGTARISGEWTVLGYYLLRRPIAAVREWTGW